MSSNVKPKSLPNTPKFSTQDVLAQPKPESSTAAAISASAEAANPQLLGLPAEIRQIFYGYVLPS